MIETDFQKFSRKSSDQTTQQPSSIIRVKNNYTVAGNYKKMFAKISTILAKHSENVNKNENRSTIPKILHLNKSPKKKTKTVWLLILRWSGLFNDTNHNPNGEYTDQQKLTEKTLFSV